MKNLRFGVKSGKAKFHQIHIGYSDNQCPTFKAHHVDIKNKKVTEVTYVGDIVSNDGKFAKNIKEKVSKATGVTSQIMSMLREVSIGYHYFDIAMICYDKRQSMVSFKRNRFKGLGWCRLNLNQKIFEVPQSTPTHLLYLETGEIPLQYILKSCRINYLHYLLNSPPGEMLTNVFKVQLINPLNDDWIEIVKKDLDNFNIKESFDEIAQMKAEIFKK